MISIERLIKIAIVVFCCVVLASCGNAQNAKNVQNQNTQEQGCDTTEENLIINSHGSVLAKYKIAFILLGRNEADITDFKIKMLDKIKNSFPESFKTATLNLVEDDIMDVSYGVVPMVMDEAIIEEMTQCGWEGMRCISFPKVAQKFYETNPDQFDFISIHLAFKDETGPTGMHTNAKNSIEGIGIPLSDSTSNWGSAGRLLGANLIQDWGLINETDNEVYFLMSQNILNHEIGHQWGVYVGDDFIAGNENAQLEIKDKGHFYRGLESPFKEGDAMGGSNFWISNCDGTFRIENSAGLRKYHPFQLYFMGLLTRENFDFNRKFKIYNAGTKSPFNTDKALIYSEVSINDIIAVEGERIDYRN